jgi:hypothetical protein
MWPTPRAANPGSRPNGKGGKILAEEVAIAEGLRERGVKKFPTPRAEDGQCAGGHRGTDDTLYGAICKPKDGSVDAGGQLNPTWVEWLMGWPLGWTDCAAPATARFRQWLDSHGRR